MATITTRGQYDNTGLDNWNGAPVSETNQPTFEQNQLSATWNFYVRPDERNVLYLQVTDVLDTTYGFISGAPFFSVALTGFDFSLGDTRPVMNPSRVSFSADFANPGQSLNGVLGGPTGHLQLDSTPGWSFAPQAETFSLSADSADYAFSHFTTVWGTSRIGGGGVFAFEFDPNFDLERQIDFSRLSGHATHGADQYAAPGTLTYWRESSHGGGVPAVPEPETYAMMLAGLAAIAISTRRRRK